MLVQATVCQLIRAWQLLVDEIKWDYVGNALVQCLMSRIQLVLVDLQLEFLNFVELCLRRLWEDPKVIGIITWMGEGHIEDTNTLSGFFSASYGVRSPDHRSFPRTSRGLLVFLGSFVPCLSLEISIYLCKSQSISMHI
jgi:hypothetical protein